MLLLEAKRFSKLPSVSIWMWKAVRKVPFQKLWSKRMSLPWAFRKQPLNACVEVVIRIRVPQWMEGAPSDKPMFGANMELLKSAVRNVDNGTNSYPGESEGKEGLMASETCFFSTLPEMPNHGASYQSKEWKMLVDEFGLLQWQPAPLLNTLWKQFLLCNAGESQQIINLSQYSPSAHKYKSLPRSCKGKPFPSLKFFSA